MEMSMAAMEHEEISKHKSASAEQIQAFDAEMARNHDTLKTLRDDLLSANRVLVQAKSRVADAFKEVRVGLGGCGGGG